jgi:hypothetical protein
MAYVSVISLSPVSGATGVSKNIQPSAVFDREMYANSINFQNVQLTDEKLNVVQGTVSYSAETKTVTFIPAAALSYSKTYIFTIVGDPYPNDTTKLGVLSKIYECMSGNVSVTFTTEAEPVVPPDPPQPPTPTNTQGYASSSPAIGEIMVPADFKLHDHKMYLTFAQPIYVLWRESTGILSTDLYGHLEMYGGNCIGLAGSLNPEMSFRFFYKSNISDAVFAPDSVTPENTIDVLVRPGTTDNDVILEFGVRTDEVLWENIDLPLSYQYVLTIKAGIGSTAASVNIMTSNVIVWFVTKLEPMYTTIQTVRLNIGPYIRYVPDDTIARLIYEISWLVRKMYYEMNEVWLSIDDIDLVPAAVIQYVICKSKLDALDAAFADYTGTGSGVAKQLGDFRTERGAVGGNPFAELRKKYLQCLTDSGIQAGIDPNRLVVRDTVFAENDPRRPITDESWRRWPKAPTILNQNGMWPEAKPYLARNLDDI